MSRALLVLNCRRERERAKAWIDKAPDYTRVEFKAPRRSLEQNALMWVLLSEVASQVRWHGIKLAADDWKLMMLDALKREVRMVPNIDGNGFVSLGRSSSDLSKEEMGDLIELIRAFGAQHGVVFADDQSPAPAGIEEGRPRESAHQQEVSSEAGEQVAPSTPALPAPPAKDAPVEEWIAFAEAVLKDATAETVEDLWNDHVAGPLDESDLFDGDHVEVVKVFRRREAEVAP